jgi:hydrogenase maturation protease
MTTPTLSDVPAPAARTDRPVTIFACGERRRGDDAVGFVIADAVREAFGARVRIVDDGMLDAGQLIELDDGEPCIVVDAVSGVAAGEIAVLPLTQLARAAIEREQRGRGPTARSSHLVSIETALGLAERLLGEPVPGTFVGVGVGSCAFGAPLSAAVAAAVPRAVAAVSDALATFGATR